MTGFFSNDSIYGRAMNKLWELIVLSVLWTVCCLPLFTVGASTTAAYYTAAKVIKKKTGTVAKSFFSAFRTNFKNSLGISLITEVLLALLVAEAVYILGTPAIPLWSLYAVYAVILLTLGIGFTLCVCLSRFQLSGFGLWKMALPMTFRHLPRTALFLLLFGVAVVGVYLMPWAIFVLPGGAFWIAAMLMEPVLLKHMPKPASEEEKSKWYYQ